MVESVFQPSKILTFETVQSDTVRLRKHLRKDSEISCIRLNLSNVERCDSTGLALLIEAKRLCLRKKIQFQVEDMPERISALAKFCGVDAIISI